MKGERSLEIPQESKREDRLSSAAVGLTASTTPASLSQLPLAKNAWSDTCVGTRVVVGCTPD